MGQMLVNYSIELRVHPNLRHQILLGLALTKMGHPSHHPRLLQLVLLKLRSSLRPHQRFPSLLHLQLRHWNPNPLLWLILASVHHFCQNLKIRRNLGPFLSLYHDCFHSVGSGILATCDLHLRN